MAYQSLYRKYRSDSFDKIYGQKVSKTILLNSIVNNKISHAYLFFGPRGTGKTSMAKLFARAVNCLDPINGECCDKCINCLASKEKECVDIIEIDAASNNGVDEIRELKSKINFVPNSLKYKVYIIDEVHMMSTGAFNALLKTLEEPPNHVIFILATTDFYKVPATIMSRCQILEFKNIDDSSMFQRLKEISDLENINIDQAAIQEIVQNSNGGLRDAVGLLDKANVFTNGNISVDDIRDVLGIIPRKDLHTLVDKILLGEIDSLLKKINEYSSDGKDLIKIMNELILLIGNKIVSEKRNDLLSIVNILNEYQIKMKYSQHSKLFFELAILESNERLINDRKNISREIKTIKEVTNDKKENVGSKNISQEISEKKPINTEKCRIRINNSFVNANKTILLEIKQKWKTLSQHVFDADMGSLICDLVDSVPVVANHKNLMVCTEYVSGSDKINENLEEYELILHEKISLDQKLISVDKSQWDKLKGEYLKKMKQNEAYEYISEEKKQIVSNKTIETLEDNDIINKAQDLFGSIVNKEEN